MRHMLTKLAASLGNRIWPLTSAIGGDFPIPNHDPKKIQGTAFAVKVCKHVLARAVRLSVRIG